MLELGLDVGLEGGETVLYLGAANGTTVSHVADFCGPTYAIEFAPRPMRDLLEVAQTRPNIIPQLADARRPGQYRHVVEAGVDVIIQDVATRDQASVAIQNSPFLAPDGRVVAAIKARSEDVTKKPESVFEEVLERLREKYYIDQTKRLDAFHTDHLAVIAHPQERGLPSSGSI
jgi:fibrillarin-like pre-rRNA processing protein